MNPIDALAGLRPLLASVAVVALVAPARATVVVVTQLGSGFSPSDVTIAVGDTVRWQWTSTIHSVTEGTDGISDGNELFNGFLGPGSQTFEFTFDAAVVAANPRPNGLYDYFCEIHFPGMKGKVRLAPTGTSFCAGDGTTATPCPCGNTGGAGRGCQNSASTGGARLVAHGSPADDNVVLTSSGELPTALSIFLQTSGTVASGVVFGDGVRCVDGNLKRIAVGNAVLGTAHYPHVGDPSIGVRSAALGDPIAPGTSRYYQTYYRDSNAAFCPEPAGSTFNVGNAVEIAW